MDFLLAIPVASAEAERGFSAMKKTKSDWRAKLNDDHLTDLLLIQLESPEIKDFDPIPAIDLWNTSGVRVRRPFVQGQAVQGVETEEDIAEEKGAWIELGVTI